jgi:hypothetical protein
MDLPLMSARRRCLMGGLTVFVALVLGGDGPASTLGERALVREIMGPFPSWSFGEALAVAGDFDGDLLADLAVGSPPGGWGVGLVHARALPGDGEYSVWVEDAPGGGAFSVAGVLTRGRMVLDSRHGDRLPGFSPDGPSLSGRLLEVREGLTVVLRGLLP